MKCVELCILTSSPQTVNVEYHCSGLRYPRESFQRRQPQLSHFVNLDLQHGDSLAMKTCNKNHPSLSFLLAGFSFFGNCSVSLHEVYSWICDNRPKFQVNCEITNKHVPVAAKKACNSGVDEDQLLQFGIFILKS